MSNSLFNKLFSPLRFPCSNSQEFVYDYLEGGLGVLKKRQFVNHLSNCKVCAEYVSLYKMAAEPSAFLQQNPIPVELLEKTREFLKAKGCYTGS